MILIENRHRERTRLVQNALSENANQMMNSENN